VTTATAPEPPEILAAREALTEAKRMVKEAYGALIVAETVRDEANIELGRLLAAKYDKKATP
jgi:predicted RNase H-like HicB family nuclease